VRAHGSISHIWSLGQCPRAILYKSYLPKPSWWNMTFVWAVVCHLIHNYAIQLVNRSSLWQFVHAHCANSPIWAWDSTHMLLCTRAVPHSLLWTQGICLGYGVLPHIQLRHLNIQQKPLLALVHAHRANSPITSLGQCPQGITYKSSLPQPPWKTRN
jgi:hypothetical protein